MLAVGVEFLTVRLLGCFLLFQRFFQRTCELFSSFQDLKNLKKTLMEQFILDRFICQNFRQKNQAFLKLALKDYPVQAVFDCAYQGYFLASALHGGFESLTIAFFALRPAPALLRAVQRFLKNSTFHDDLAWNSMGFGPWGCFLVEL